MLTLGINISHNASSCLMNDGKIIYYCEEERLSKRKTHYYWPDDSKFYGLDKLKKYNVSQLDHIIFASYRREYDSEDTDIINSIINQIQDAQIKILNRHYYEEYHHMYHAYLAFYGSGFDDAVAIVADGSGTYTYNHWDYRELETIYDCNRQNINTIFKHSSTQNCVIQGKLIWDTVYEPYEHLLSNAISSAGLFSTACEVFKLGDGSQAGKVMGMSSYGEIVDTTDWIKQLGVNVVYTTECFNKLMNFKEVDDFKIKANVAKKIQVESEKHTIKLIEKALIKSNSKNVILSGGYFQNCVNNYKYLKAFPDINFYVDPISYDGGTAIGACMYIEKLVDVDRNIEPIKTLFLGGLHEKNCTE